jgi:hypothetical protein
MAKVSSRFNWQLEEQLRFERKRFWKFEEMVETRMDHMFDHFDDFMLEARNVLETNLSGTAGCAIRKFGLNLSKEWFENFDMECDKGFTVINMDEFHENYWLNVIEEMDDMKRASRLVGIQAVLWGSNVTGILFQDDDVEMLRREVYLIEDGNFKRNRLELKVKPLSEENFRPSMILSPRRLLAVKEKDVNGGFGITMARVKAVDWESPRYSRKLRTEILRRDYNLENLILRFPVELVV